jgi:colicin import membrane protein
MSAVLENSPTDVLPPIETQTTTALALVARSITEINALEVVIAELESRYEGVVFDVTTTEGMEAARKARQTIREPRYTLQRMRKEAKAPLNQLKKGIDEQAEGYISRISAIEDPVHLQIETEEARKEAERQARIEAERKRVADLRERIAILRGNRMLTASSGSELIGEHISDIEKMALDDTFAEFLEEAKSAKAEGLDWLTKLRGAAELHEAEQARLKAEREELARQQAAQAAERARIAEEERQGRLKREAEEREHQEQLRRQREEAEAEDRRRREALAQEERQQQARLQAARELADREERERVAAREAEDKRLADARAELDRQQAALGQIKEATDAPVQDRAASLTAALRWRPKDDAIIHVLSTTYNVPRETVVTWIVEMAQRLQSRSAA